MAASNTTLADSASDPAAPGRLGAVLAGADEFLTVGPDETRAPKLTGVVAEYGSEGELKRACEQVRDAGFTRWDSFAPYPVHGIEKSMGIKPTILPWLALGGGLTGGATGILMQWYLNGSEELANYVGLPTVLQGYNYLISGKPIWSLPANVPVGFELTILFAAFGAFFGMLGLNGLPRWSNPRFRLERFREGTDDRFLIGLDADDPKFDLEAAGEILGPTDPVAVQEVWDVEPRRPPAWIPSLALLVFAALLIPPVLLAKHRNTPWDTPRIHPVGDMDWQPKFKPQEKNEFFADGRAMRPEVPHAIARGELHLDPGLFEGKVPGPPAVALSPDEQRRAADEALFAFAAWTRRQQDAAAEDVDDPNLPAQQGASKPDASDDGAAAGGGEGAPTDGGPDGNVEPPADPGAAADDEADFVTDLPIEPTVERAQRGQLVFNIYCAPCHGVGGFGNGLVNQRASQLQQATWLTPSNLHADTVRNRPAGFLYDAITNGVRKMPAYGTQIRMEDRWNVVLYLRVLQRSQNADLAALPADARPAAEREKRVADERAAAEAAQEAARTGEVEPANDGGEPADPAAPERAVPLGEESDAPATSSSAAPSGG